jgi:hypothetical protein
VHDSAQEFSFRVEPEYVHAQDAYHVVVISSSMGNQERINCLSRKNNRSCNDLRAAVYGELDPQQQPEDLPAAPSDPGPADRVACRRGAAGARWRRAAQRAPGRRQARGRPLRRRPGAPRPRACVQSAGIGGVASTFRWSPDARTSDGSGLGYPAVSTPRGERATGEPGSAWPTTDPAVLPL